MVLKGRTVIKANYTEEQFLSGTIEQQKNKVIDVVSNSYDIHLQNRTESIYLQDYICGIQDIRKKEKLTRTDINHQGVENWAFALVDWKKNFLLGKPIQYSLLEDISTNEIQTLNKYTSYEDKSGKDLDIYEDVLTCGRGFRFINKSEITEEDEAPFDIINANVLNTEVVYSSGVKGEQLCSYICTDMQHIQQNVNPDTGEVENVVKNYVEITLYTRNRMFVLNNMANSWVVTSTKPIVFKEHLVTEYYTNKYRLSLIEIGKDIFDDINSVENFDLDDIEGFVNSIMVFTNAEITKEGMEAIQEYGAVSIKSTDQKKASVELLQSRLKSLDTQIFYLRKLSALHDILAVPQAQNNGSLNAETGKAMLTGQGFTSASIRIEGEETSIRSCDRKSLKVLLKICKSIPDGLIKNLKTSDIDIKFNRDMNDNLLVKTQALNNLITAQIPPEVANSVIGLFSDPVAVSKLQRKYMEEKQEIANQISQMQNNNDKNAEQDNEIEDTVELENQGQ